MTAPTPDLAAAAEYLRVMSDFGRAPGVVGLSPRDSDAIDVVLSALASEKARADEAEARAEAAEEKYKILWESDANADVREAEARAERLRELLVGAMYFIQHSAPDAPLLVEIRAALAPEPQPARSEETER